VLHSRTNSAGPPNRCTGEVAVPLNPDLPYRRPCSVPAVWQSRSDGLVLG
jgi:hypothetical protein